MKRSFISEDPIRKRLMRQSTIQTVEEFLQMKFDKENEIDSLKNEILFLKQKIKKLEGKDGTKRVFTM